MMELLPQEFMGFAKYNNLSDTTIRRLIGDDLLQTTAVDSENLTWRDTPSKESLNVENWKLLEKPSKEFRLKKIARREIFQEYKLFCDNKCEYLSMVGTTKYDAILFEEYNNKNKFIRSLVDKYKDFQSVDQELKSIESISEDEWFIIVALLELFLEKYPTPDANWKPTELLVFTQNSLIQIIKESENRIEDQTWWQHWKKISKHEIPNKGDIETAILMLASKRLIGYMDSVEGEDVYYIGQGLLWLIRSLSWWDRGFIIENRVNNVSLYLLQASALFILINENNTSYSLLNIDGVDLERIIGNFIGLDRKNIDTTNPEIIKEQNKQRFCTNCGKQLPEGSKFCPFCGTKVI